MNRFKVEIEIDNSVFDSPNIGHKLRRVLTDLIKKVSEYESLTDLANAGTIPLYDINKNKIGWAKYIWQPPMGDR